VCETNEIRKIKVAIIVVNWNCGNLTKSALKPYLNTDESRLSIQSIVVDNNSKDNSLEILRNLPVSLIENNKNVGFGHACNQAYNLAKDADYILLLNPDTLSDISTLEGLVDLMESNKKIGVCGPQQLNEKGLIIRSCGRFPVFSTSLFEVLSISKLFPNVFTPAPNMLEWNHLVSKEVDHIMGSYMLIRKEVIDKVGFMDEDYFVYWEDIDLTKRIHLGGYNSVFNAEFKIIHEGGASGEKARAKRLFYSISARRTYWKKHFKKESRYLLIFLSLTAEPILRILQAILRRKFSDIREIVKAYRMYVKK